MSCVLVSKSINHNECADIECERRWIFEYTGVIFLLRFIQLLYYSISTSIREKSLSITVVYREFTAYHTVFQISCHITLGVSGNLDAIAGIRVELQGITEMIQVITEEKRNL